MEKPVKLEGYLNGNVFWFKQKGIMLTDEEIKEYTSDL
jgi:hypothetical protein